MTTLQEKVERFEKMYFHLKNELKWQVVDKNYLMILSSIYGESNKKEAQVSLLSLGKTLKKQVGFFSPLNSSYSFIIAAILDAQYNDPEAKFQELDTIYNKLVDAGFKKDVFTYLCALIVLNEETPTFSVEDYADRALSLHSLMKKAHPFITSKSDYPLAMLLSRENGAPIQIIDRVENVYGMWASKGCRKGNDLQFLSHILSLQDTQPLEDLYETYARIENYFSKIGMKIKPAYYTQFAILSLLEADERKLAQIHDIAAYFNKHKAFKWKQQTNFATTVNIVMNYSMEHEDILKTSLYTTLDMVIQAQQAAMVAVIASTAANASSSDGGGGN